MNFFGQIWHQWRLEWQQARLLLVVEMIGTLLSFLPSIILATTSPHSPMMFIWGCWSVGNVCVGYAAWKRKSGWILILMLVYTLINIAGMVHLVLR